MTTLLNQTAAAALLGVKPATLEGWRHRGKGPRFRKIGALVRYALEDLNAYIEGQSRASTSEHKQLARAAKGRQTPRSEAC